MTGRRHRPYPDPGQAKPLAQWIGCARAVCSARRGGGVQCPGRGGVQGFPHGPSRPTKATRQPTLAGDPRPLEPAKTGAPWIHEVTSQVYLDAMCRSGQTWARHRSDASHSCAMGHRFVDRGGAGSSPVGRPLFKTAERLIARSSHFVQDLRSFGQLLRGVPIGFLRH